MNTKVVVGVIVGAIIAIILGLIAYSYTQVQISLDSVEFGGFDWAPASLITLAKLTFNALTGNVVGLVLSLITGVKLNLVFALSNHGVFPVYIPDLSYNLIVNGNNVGQGNSSVDTTINPGETKTLPILQDFQVSSLEPAAVAVLNAGGTMDIQVSGSANFKLLGLTISIPFQYTKQVNLIQEAENHFLRGGSQSSANSGGTYKPPTTAGTGINIQASTYTVEEGDTVTFSGRLSDSNGNSIPNQLVYVKRDIRLAPDSIVGTAYTDSNGDFTVSWVSTRPLTSNTANVYATFEGSQGYSSARSSDISIDVISKQAIPFTTQAQPSLQQQLQLAKQQVQSIQSNPSYNQHPSLSVAV